MHRSVPRAGPPSPPSPQPARRTVLACGVAAVGGLLGASVITARPASAAGVAEAAPVGRTVPLEAAASGLPFMLGAAGEGVACGDYERALGRRLDLTATWADSEWSCVNLPVLQGSGELAGWDRALDVAVGAFGPGTTWAQAAAGACDERWTASLQKLAVLRAGAHGSTYVRFAHELNGDWYPWSVTPATVGDFHAAWQRFRALQLAHFPAARLVLSLNHNTVGFDADTSLLFPGTGQVDVLGVGYYNRYPYLETAEAFAGWLPAHDRWGGPAGLDAFRELAGGWGLPLCIPEWSGCAEASGGDAPAFVTALHAWLVAHGGAGAGQVLYACQFNMSSGHEDAFTLLPARRMPAASQEYRRCFGG